MTTAWNQPYGTQQCAKARGAYSSRLAGWGYWSGFGNTSCRTPVNPIPATPSAGFNFTQQRICAPTGGLSASGSWDAVPGATSYQAQFAYRDASGISSGWGQTYSGTGRSTWWVVFGSNVQMGSASARVRASNAAGSSGWSTAITLSVTGGCQVM